MRNGFSEREIVYRAEDLILRLRDVRSCRIITDEKGAISEIHVVASSERSPKFIARDVETALKAELDLEIDYRKIGVVLMDPVSRGPENDQEDPLRERPFEEKPLSERPFIDTDGQPVSTDALVDDRFIEVVQKAVPQGAGPPETGPPEADLHEAAQPEAAPQAQEEAAPGPYFEKPVEYDRRNSEQPVEFDRRKPAPGPPPEIFPEKAAPSGTEPGLEFLEDGMRIGFRGLSLSMEEGSIRTEVKLSGNGMEVTGCVDDCCGSRPVFESIAGAAVKALVELLDEDFHLCLSEIRELEITGRKALVAVVDMIRGRDSSSFSGCAFVGRDSGEAAVMAVLDAVNRPFGRWKSRREIHYRIR